MVKFCLPKELKFQLGDKKWSDLSDKEKLAELRWCIVRLWSNRYLTEDRTIKLFYTQEMNQCLILKKDLENKIKFSKGKYYEVG